MHSSLGATAFWQNLHKAKLESQKVKSQLDPDGELVEVEVRTLELAANTTFMGYIGGLSSILVPPHYTALWKEVEPLIAERLADPTSAAQRRAIRYVYTGTPGIGKSAAGWYFMYELRKQHSDKIDIVYQRERSGQWQCRTLTRMLPACAVRCLRRSRTGCCSEVGLWVLSLAAETAVPPCRQSRDTCCFRVAGSWLNTCELREELYNLT